MNYEPTPTPPRGLVPLERCLATRTAGTPAVPFFPAAAFGGYLSKHAPRRPLTITVGCLALGIAVYRALFS